jgi:hypothetical protein
MVRKWLCAMVGSFLLGASLGSGVALASTPTPTTTSATLYDTPATVLDGARVMLRVTVSPQPAVDGTITVTDDLDPTFTATRDYPHTTTAILVVLDGGLAFGPHQLRAAFSGSGTLAPSTSAMVALRVIHQTTTRIEGTKLTGRTYRFDVAVDPAPTTPAQVWVSFQDPEDPLAAVDLAEDGTGSVEHTFDTAEHDVSAEYGGATDFAPSGSGAFVVKGIPSFALSVSGTRTAGYLLTFKTVAPFPQDAVLELWSRHGGSDTKVGESFFYDDPAGDGMRVFLGSTDALPAGTNVVTARFAGSDRLEPGTSSPLTLTIAADRGVDVRSYAISPATFYPAKDGYRDTTTLTITPGEQLYASTSVYNASGTKVRSLGARTTNDPIRLAWEGRKSDGSLLPAGTYTIKTYLKDHLGNAVTKAASVTLSAKRLVSVSATLSRDGSAYSYYQRDGGGLVLRSESAWSTGVFLDSGRDDYGGNQARVFYRFALPSAISYKTLRFYVLGRAVTGRGSVGIWDYDAEYWDDGLTIAGYGWSSFGIGATNRVRSGQATGVVIANGYYDSLFDVRQVKLVVSYTVLR